MHLSFEIGKRDPSRALTEYIESASYLDLIWSLVSRLLKDLAMTEKQALNR